MIFSWLSMTSVVMLLSMLVDTESDELPVSRTVTFIVPFGTANIALAPAKDVLDGLLEEPVLGAKLSQSTKTLDQKLAGAVNATARERDAPVSCSYQWRRTRWRERGKLG